MNALARFNPLRPSFDPCRELQEAEGRIGKSLGWLPGTRGGGRGNLTLVQWAPAVDITEDESEFLIRTELPDLRKEDVKVTVENGELSITGERKFEKEEKHKKYHRVERSYGSFCRSFTPPDGVSGEKVKSDFKDGMFSVHLPKDKQSTSTAVQVNMT